jgi:hypothetical protein
MSQLLDGDGQHISQLAWAELPNLGTKEAQLRVKIQIASHQLALAWAEYNDYQATRGLQSRGSVTGQTMVSAQAGGPGASVPDATMEEAHDEDVGA